MSDNPEVIIHCVGKCGRQLIYKEAMRKWFRNSKSGPFWCTECVYKVSDRRVAGERPTKG